MAEKEKKGCSCPHCEPELKNGCFNPGFCKPCGAQKDNKIKMCSKCKAEYSAEYEECPSCKASQE